MAERLTKNPLEFLTVNSTWTYSDYTDFLEEGLSYRNRNGLNFLIRESIKSKPIESLFDEIRKGGVTLQFNADTQKLSVG